MEDAKKYHNGLKNPNGSLVIREFQPADTLQVHQIFYVGVMEMITDTAFRGLRHHPESLMLYSSITVVLSAVTMCWWMLGLVPALVLCARYFYSRRDINGFLEQVMSTDMDNIEEFYMKPADSCMWVAVLDDRVVGAVAAVGTRESKDAIELKRMTVDPNVRKCGIGLALGCKVLEFAATQNCPTVFLGTTAYQPAPHRLYQRLGFRCVGVTNGYVPTGTTQTLLEKMFYRVRRHHYRLDIQKQ